MPFVINVYLMKYPGRLWSVTFCLFFAVSIFIHSSCRKPDPPSRVVFQFRHIVKDSILVKDDLRYMNAAANRYEVDELQYFISDITLWKVGKKTMISADNGIHYCDIDIPGTLSWSPGQEIAAGTYDSVSFIFGISEAKNISGIFVNPPERDMFWPEMMGGGYHYMKMNGKWEKPSGETEAFNMHLGIGMTEDLQGNVQFVHNCFTVTLPLDDCYISGDMVAPGFIIIMDINSWFETPYIWDWNIIGGHIMQNQEAMQRAAKNGADAFSVQYTGFHPE